MDIISLPNSKDGVEKDMTYKHKKKKMAL